MFYDCRKYNSTKINLKKGICFALIKYFFMFTYHDMIHLLKMNYNTFCSVSAYVVAVVVYVAVFAFVCAMFYYMLH